MNIDDLLSEMGRVAKNCNYPIISPEKAEFLVGLIREREPERVLEIGTLIGYSAIAMADKLPVGGKLVSLECNTTSAKLAQRNIKKARFDDRITVVVGKALKILPELKGGFDFVFIDADKNEYLDYFNGVRALLAKDALVVADNVGRFPQETEKFLVHVRRDDTLVCENIAIGDDSMELIRFA